MVALGQALDAVAGAHEPGMHAEKIGIGGEAPEQLAARLDEVTERAGETVPLSGSAQGSNEIAKALAGAAR